MWYNDWSECKVWVNAWVVATKDRKNIQKKFAYKFSKAKLTVQPKMEDQSRSLGQLQQWCHVFHEQFRLLLVFSQFQAKLELSKQQQWQRRKQPMSENKWMLIKLTMFSSLNTSSTNFHDFIFENNNCTILDNFW